MNSRMRTFTAALLLCTASAHGLAAEAGRDGRSVQEVASYQGADRLARLIDGARREGELSVYFAHPIVQGVLDPFGQKYGIKLRHWRGGSEALQQRLMAEVRSGKFEVDRVANTALDIEANRREKLLQELWSPAQQDLMPAALPAHRQWTAFNLDVFTAGYNTKRVRKDELPKTYQDLLDPKWKGRLAVEANDHVWFASLLGEIGDERGRQLGDAVVIKEAQ